MPAQLDGRVAVVTGAASGIGRAVALACPGRSEVGACRRAGPIAGSGAVALTVARAGLRVERRRTDGRTHVMDQRASAVRDVRSATGATARRAT